MESKGSKFVTMVSELCMITIMLLPFITGQLHVSEAYAGSVKSSGQQGPKHAVSMQTLLDLNDPVPVR
ncbi:hypothetical protein QVE09_26290 [Paenibacillus sp. ClWae2A]|uniref:hypothetical protein n=1 Tax=Paenibacillus sp. ClWae2A TaxID=3057177 RepID=UPI0028F5AEA5|nr:hypothetical protein [Paenibacillus sp. ClWae2A]MDT9722417.1 hypothetical protein [Paenibacillus sp. ClWae2A]